MPNPYGLDTLGLWDATYDLPAQLTEALAAAPVARGLIGPQSSDSINSIVLLGMGSSGWAATVVAKATGGSVPVTVLNEVTVPPFVGVGTLVLAISWSGQTEETLRAARAAHASGAIVVVLSGGGSLADWAAEVDIPFLSLPANLPASRCAWGATVVTALAALAHFGLSPDVSASLHATSDHLRRRRDALAALDGPAAVVARRIGRTIPLIYGSAGLPSLSALHWKQLFNVNAKTPAFASVQPELSHNEIAGWGQNGDVTRQVFSLVTLRYAGEDPSIVRRVDMVNEAIDEVMSDIIEVWADGDDDVCRLFDLAYFGDFVSLHVAGREGTDPGPTPAVEAIKAATG